MSALYRFAERSFSVAPFLDTAFFFRPLRAIICMNYAPEARLSLAPWLIRIPQIFSPWTAGLLELLGCKRSTPLGPEFHLIHIPDPEKIHHGPASPFISWNLPIHHSWPCHPPKMERFIEKAAQSLHKKFSPLQPQSLQVGPLQTAAPDRYYKSLASNLRGRALQLFPLMSGSAPADTQDPDKPTLFCLAGKEGLFAGLQSPRACNGFFPGGALFVSQNADSTISRAGAKVAEALHYLLLHRPAPPAGWHWLELGASPGGMTSELLQRGQRVTALDRAPLDRRLDGHPGLTYWKADAASFQPPSGTVYDALLCDMNGDSRHALRSVIRLTKYLRPGSLMIFTLKTPGSDDLDSLLDSIRLTLEDATHGRLKLISLTHLSHNRQEFTCFFESPTR